MMKSTSRSAAAAADWAVRIETSTLSDDAWTQFAAWMDADPEHVAAFTAAQADLGAVDAALASGRASVAPSGSMLPWRPPIVIGSALAAGGAVAAAAVFAFLRLGAQESPAEAHYASAGSALPVQLADASKITLNRKSTIDVRYSRTLRRVILAPGSEAAFDVARDPNRPFVISAGAQTVRVLGTAFDVKDDPESFTVAVSRGIVHVSANGPGPGFDLAVGRRLVLTKASGVWTSTTVAPGDVGSWRKGRLVYDAAPLAEVAADIARAGASTVVVAPDARALTFTGVLKFSDSRSMAKTLALFLPIEAKISRDQIVMRVRRH
jgi:transmembrane sensor